MSNELGALRNEETKVFMMGSAVMDAEMQDKIKQLHEIQVSEEKKGIEEEVAPSKMNTVTVAEIREVEQEIDKINDNIDDVVKSKHRYMVLSGIFLFLCIVCLVARVIAW